MRRTISIAIVLCAALLIDATFGTNTASAQSRGLFGNGGQTSGGGIGGGLSGGSGLGGANTGRQTGGRGGGRLNDSSLINGPSTGNDFVGSNAADLQRFVGASQANAQGGSQQIIRGLEQAFQSNQPDNQNTGTAQRKFRTRVRIGFLAVPISNIQVSSHLSRTLEKRLQLRLTSGTRVVISERTATLRGSVATSHARRLAEQLAMLEPGISRVANEIVVAPPQDDQP